MTEKLGGRFFYGITGDYLEKDETGRVVALIGHNYKKEYIRFRANNGVILTAGDFSGNKAMVMDLLGEYAALTEQGGKYQYLPAGRKGKGVQMGLYATGNCSGERFPIMYTTPIAGVSIGIAYTLGRIVGDYVARNK